MVSVQLLVDMLERFLHTYQLFPKVKKEISQFLTRVFIKFMVQMHCQTTEGSAQNSRENRVKYVCLGD